MVRGDTGYMRGGIHGVRMPFAFFAKGWGTENY